MTAHAGSTLRLQRSWDAATIDYRPIFEAAKKAHIEHAFVEQEEFDMPPMEALKIDAEYMHALKV